MDIVLRRRAVLTGLRPFLDDEELLSAVSLWERGYAHQPSFALSGFISRCCFRAELKAQRGQMLRAVVSAMELPEAQLLPDPGSLGGDTISLGAQAAATKPDEQTRMFALLLAAMLANLDARTEGTIRGRLLTHLKADEGQGLRDWLAGHGTELSQSYSLALLRDLINQAYVAMCEALGPVKADQVLAQAIRQADAQGARLGFRVHDLL
ncbi:hypothetical protein [Methylobacillus sp.]|uniref:hypothetical protein n=1 Tax=Methylobacillus sp. TaxID=56818 RepID=UPI0012C01279|nr:hypothetical protein [Methylobacillus sp.]MPS48745.1 hypothetical protein [Methylobacillus sp.]